jgi:hypothetical protein
MVHTINLPWKTACLPGFDQAVAGATGCDVDKVHCDLDVDGTAELRIDCRDLDQLRGVVAAVRQLTA